MSTLQQTDVTGATGHVEISGGVTAPAGFSAVGIHCGVKKAKKDLALVVSAVPAATAATHP